MEDALSTRLTDLLHKVQEADKRCGGGSTSDDIAEARQLAVQYYNELKRLCDQGRAVVIHTNSAIDKKEEIRSIGEFDPEMLATTYSPNPGTRLCITQMALTEGDYVEVK